MANKAISELPQAQNVNNQDLFVLEQSGIAKKLPAETFITEQGIINALAEALDGHGGISSVTLASVSGRIRTYRITFTDQSATTFQVYDGTSIDRISRTSSSGLDDVYTIFLSDGTTTFFTVHNGADGTVSEAMLNDALKDKAPAVTETTESSAIANFTDGADDLVMHNIVAEINPVQSGSGDPSPSNVRTISGWTGCNVTRTGINVWDEEVERGAISVSTGENTPNNDRLRSKNYISVKSGTSYYFKSTANIEKFMYDADKNYLGLFPSDGDAKNVVRTIPSGCAYIRLCIYTAYGTTYNHDISINYPSTDHDYHSGTDNVTVSLSWQTEAGTVYGGTIDVATGLLTVDRAMVDMGTLTWNYSSTSDHERFYAQIPAKGAPSSETANAACSIFKVTTNNNTYAHVFDNSLSIGTSGYVYVYASAYSDAATFKTAMNGAQLCYELVTPQTYQLTPQEVLHTLYGVNNVWTDIGNVTVTYVADTKMFIEKLTMPTEDDLVANQAITSGKYFMIGNSLYLALANIASGAQITIGTNAQRVSLADALNTINS